MTKFSLHNLFSDEFHSSEIDTEELERIVIDAVEREHPNRSVEDVQYTEEGLNITLDDGTEIEIEIDWQEIILT
jgi:hypothetical protein